MQNFFRFVSSLSILYLVFVTIKEFRPELLDGNLSKFLGGIGSFIFPIITAIVTFLVGKSEEASKEISKNISDIGNGWFRVGDVTVTVNEKPKKISNRKK